MLILFLFLAGQLNSEDFCWDKRVHGSENACYVAVCCVYYFPVSA